MGSGVGETWTSWLWDGAQEIYDQILTHPFLDGLTSWTLPEERFAYYVAQDAFYLQDYARTLAVVASKAPSHVDSGMLARHAAETAEVELVLHEVLLPQLDIDPATLAAIPVSPTTRAYTSYLLATAHGGSFAEGLAAVLPCYWIYRRVGASLVSQGSPNPRYQRWIDTYAGEEFAATVRDVLDLADRVGQSLPGAEAWRTLQHFATTTRYEWMFWDAAWRMETWPV